MKRSIHFTALFVVSLMLPALFPLTSDAQRRSKAFVADTGIVALSPGQNLVLTIVNQGNQPPLAFCYQKVTWTFFDIDYAEFRKLKRSWATECIAKEIDPGAAGILTIETTNPDVLHQIRMVFPTDTPRVTAQILDVATKQFTNQFDVDLSEDISR